MYINKKSLPESIRNEINMKELNKLLEIEKALEDTIHYSLNYQNKYMINVEWTTNRHKTRGVEYQVVSAREIYLIDQGRIYTRSIEINY